MQALALVALSLLSAAVADVPLGVCHQCEVTCFSDCNNKYNEEIIQAERRDYEAKQRMLRIGGSEHLAARGLAGVSLDFMQADAEKNGTNHVFAWRAAHPEEEKMKLAEQKQIAKGERFAKCLEKNKCPGHSLKPGSDAAAKCPQFLEPPASFLATKATPSKLPASQCAMRCANEIAEEDMNTLEKPSMLQKKKKPDFPLYPVRRGMFKKGTLTLDFCLKSCLAVTCGCSDAPGFDALDALFGQVKNNIKAQFPVVDTNPKWQYHPSTMHECAKGQPGKKETKGMWIYTGGEYGDGGWVEICSMDLINSMFGPAYPETKKILTRCKSRKPEDEDFGCTWDIKNEKCTVGFVPVNVECQVRGKMDLMSNTEGKYGAADANKALAEANEVMG